MYNVYCFSVKWNALVFVFAKNEEKKLKFIIFYNISNKS